jgi:DNA-binding protein HU-beta
MAPRPTAAKKSAKSAALSSGRKQATKAAAPAAKKASAASVITLRAVAEQLAETHDLPKRAATAILDDMVRHVTEHLKRGERIRLGGLGILEVRSRPARMGRNPATGEPVQIKASKKVAFRPAKALKEAI